MTGRMMNERIGKISFWIMFIGFNVGFFPMHILGLIGMPRRIYTYQAGLGFDNWNVVVTAGAFTLGIGILVSIINLFVSLRDGDLAGNNPWNSDGLEWSTSSPPKPYGSLHIPLVASRHPLWDDFDEEEDPDNDRVLDGGRLTPTTTWLDAVPVGIATIPEDSLVPFLMSVAMFGMFVAFTFGASWIALGMLILTFIFACVWMWPRTVKEIMLSSAVQIPPPRTRLATLPIDQQRGLNAMWLVILTEAMLFVCMFGAYYYLGSNKDRWGEESPPDLMFPFILLAILLGSSIVLHWGERQVRVERFGAARIALWITVVLGIVFTVIQSIEYVTQWKQLSISSDSYGSIFYTITSLHGAHVIVGLLMLAYVGIQPRFGKTMRSPHKPYETVARYWHFVDVVWIFIVALLYVVPHFQAIAHGH